MPPKSKKSSVLWKICENCKANITLKDHEAHALNCPPDFKKWRHHFVLEGTLYSELNIKQGDDYNGLNPRWIDDYVFLSQSVMLLCGFVIGDYVLIYLKDKNTWLVKCAWPCFEKSLTSVLVSQRVFASLDISSEELNVTVSQLRSWPLPLEKIHISFLKEPEADFLDDLKIFIEGQFTNKLLQPIKRQTVQFFGKVYKFDILKTEPYSVAEDIVDKISKLDIADINVPILYKVVPTTTWCYLKETNQNNAEVKLLSHIGGLDDVISELRDILAFALGLRKGLVGLKLISTRGVLLYGHTGCGKTLLARSIIQDSGAHLVQITGPEIFSKFFGATESTLKSCFIEAKQNAPSVILLDEIDILCPARPGTDQERRVTSALLRCLDELQPDDTTALQQSPVAIIATTSRPDNLDPAVRRAGRLETEIELPVPDAAARLDILNKLLSRFPNQCSAEVVNRISKSAHGCTGADLAGLCSIAVSQAVKRVAASAISETCEMKHSRNLGSGDSDTAKSICLLDSDLEFAAMNTKPSAMREVAVEVPDVKWDDIGGQHDLKLKLKQAVEWPLTHPESFLRLGITPPRGVLMYGPPGCSKTMIAKALASESGLNFLSVKGPELFSQYVGESERAVRDLFRRARRVAPAIVFFDEIDALGCSRGSGQSNSGSNVQERVLAQLLTELDGVAPLGNVTIVAATNRPDRLDKALLRPGRLDRIVYVPLPDLSTRHEIFSLALSRMPATRDVNVDNLALFTEGYSGAEVRAVCHEAAMIALEQNMDAKEMTWSHFESALKRVQPRTPKELLKLYEDYANES